MSADRSVELYDRIVAMVSRQVLNETADELEADADCFTATPEFHAGCIAWLRRCAEARGQSAVLGTEEKDGNT